MGNEGITSSAVGCEKAQGDYLEMFPGSHEFRARCVQVIYQAEAFSKQFPKPEKPKPPDPEKLNGCTLSFWDNIIPYKTESVHCFGLMKLTN